MDGIRKRKKALILLFGVIIDVTRVNNKIGDVIETGDKLDSHRNHDPCPLCICRVLKRGPCPLIIIIILRLSLSTCIQRTWCVCVCVCERSRLRFRKERIRNIILSITSLFLFCGHPLAIHYLRFVLLFIVFHISYAFLFPSIHNSPKLA